MDSDSVVLPAIYGALAGTFATAGAHVCGVESDASHSTADKNTAVNLFVLMSLGLLVIKSIFRYFSVCLLALCLAAFAGAVMVMAGDLFARSNTTRKAGQVLQNRIYCWRENYTRLPIRSCFECGVWLTANFTSYYLSRSFIHAAQFGTVVGICTVLLVEELSRSTQMPKKDLEEMLDVALDIGRKFAVKKEEQARKQAKKPLQKLPEYTMAEVGKHNTLEDCWIVCNGRVYDLSKWGKHHPGGIKPIQHFAGLDATDELRNFHADWVIEKKLPIFLIGTVSDPVEPSEKVKDFRALYNYVEAMGYFEPSMGFYYKHFTSCSILFIMPWILVLGSSVTDSVRFFVFFGGRVVRGSAVVILACVPGTVNVYIYLSVIRTLVSYQKMIDLSLKIVEQCSASSRCRRPGHFLPAGRLRRP